jgi:hypothetical protein
MSKTTRRDFLRRTGISVAGVSTLSLQPLTETRAAPAFSGAAAAIPPHRALDVPGVHAYPIEHSVAASETLELCVSASVPYSISICRLGLNVDDPAGDTVCADLGEQPAVPRPIHPGSYVHIARALRGSFGAFTVECWVRPWDLTRLQGIVSQEDKDSSEGFALGLGSEGYVGFYLGDGVSPDENVVHRTKPGLVTRNKWHHLVGTWDGKSKRIYVNGDEVGAWDFAGPLKPGPHPLRLGAMAQGGMAQHFLDGDIAMPVLYRRALTAGKCARAFRSADWRLHAVVRCWATGRLMRRRARPLLIVRGKGGKGESSITLPG